MPIGPGGGSAPCPNYLPATGNASTSGGTGRDNACADYGFLADRQSMERLDGVADGRFTGSKPALVAVRKTMPSMATAAIHVGEAWRWYDTDFLSQAEALDIGGRCGGAPRDYRSPPPYGRYMRIFPAPHTRDILSVKVRNCSLDFSVERFRALGRRLSKADKGRDAMDHPTKGTQSIPTPRGGRAPPGRDFRIGPYRWSGNFAAVIANVGHPWV